jgi:Plasmid pRiA4b ORF-3-like protein
MAEACKRLIKNCIICWNYLYLSQKLEDTEDAASREAFLEAVANGESFTVPGGQIRGNTLRVGVGNLPDVSESSLLSITIYQLRVVLCGVSPLVWRRLLVASDTTIAELHEILQSVLKTIESIKWYLWHGNVFQALRHLQFVEMDLEGAAFEKQEKQEETTRKLLKAVEEFSTYIQRNRGFIPNYGERYRNGERISTGLVESAVNQVVSKRMAKKQQMQWTQRGAHLLLQVRTRVLNEEWEDVFRRWYPDFRQQQSMKAAA